MTFRSSQSYRLLAYDRAAQDGAAEVRDDETDPANN